ARDREARVGGECAEELLVGTPRRIHVQRAFPGLTFLGRRVDWPPGAGGLAEARMDHAGPVGDRGPRDGDEDSGYSNRDKSQRPAPLDCTKCAHAISLLPRSPEPGRRASGSRHVPIPRTPPVASEINAAGLLARGPVRALCWRA